MRGWHSNGRHRVVPRGQGIPCSSLAIGMVCLRTVVRLGGFTCTEVKLLQCFIAMSKVTFTAIAKQVIKLVKKGKISAQLVLASRSKAIKELPKTAKQHNKQQTKATGSMRKQKNFGSPAIRTRLEGDPFDVNPPFLQTLGKQTATAG